MWSPPSPPGIGNMLQHLRFLADARSLSAQAAVSTTAPEALASLVLVGQGTGCRGRHQLVPCSLRFLSCPGSSVEACLDPLVIGYATWGGVLRPPSCQSWAFRHPMSPQGVELRTPARVLYVCGSRTSNRGAMYVFVLACECAHRGQSS